MTISDSSDPAKSWKDWAIGALLKAACVYLALSIVTQRFINSWWLGEIPVLAIFQFPKLKYAYWLRVNAVMPLIDALGLSSGSFSPDYMMARPYALLLTYAIAGLVVLGVLALSRSSASHRRWAIVLALLAIVDYWLIMRFGEWPITIY